MAGTNQAVNLGGMLSQTAEAAGRGLDPSVMAKMGRGIENMTRPDVDMSDPASVQAMMNWQTKLGRTDEAALSGRRLTEMNAQAERTAARAAVADEKSKAEYATKVSLGLQSAYAAAVQNGDIERQDAIRKMAAEKSQELGVNINTLLYQVDGQTRAQESGERAKQQALAAQEAVEARKAYDQTIASYSAAASEQREALMAAAVEKGDGTTVVALQEFDRSNARWVAEQEKSRREGDARAMPPVTPGERAVLDAEVARATELQEGVGERFANAIKAIEEDGLMSDELKRKKIASLHNTITQFNFSQTSAELAAGRAYEKALLNRDDLKPAPQHQYDRAKEALTTEKWYSLFIPDTKGQALRKKAEEADLEDELVRRVAIAFHNFPLISNEEAFEIAAKDMGLNGAKAETAKTTKTVTNDPNTKSYTELK